MAEKIAKTTKRTPRKPKKTAPAEKERYFEAVGRRKSAVARVRLYLNKANVEINDRPLANYFPLANLQKKALSPIEKLKIEEKLGAVIKVSGGGPTGQAEAIRLGIARALVKFNEEFKKRLRRLGLLTRDQRTVERKKYGLKKARRAPQWKKR